MRAGEVKLVRDGQANRKERNTDTMKNKFTYITREDEGVGVGKFDSNKWAFEMY